MDVRELWTGGCGYTEDLIALVQLSAEVSWPPGQDEGDEDSLSVFSSNNVESQTCGASVDQNPAWLPGQEMEEGEEQMVKALSNQ